MCICARVHLSSHTNNEAPGPLVREELAARRDASKKVGTTVGSAMTLAKRIIEQIGELFSAPDLPHFTDDDITPPWKSGSRSLDR